MSNRRRVPYDVAVQMLPDGERIHTFVSIGPILIGADWDRANILERFKERVESSGPIAASMNHRLCFYDVDHWVFVETEKDKLSDNARLPTSKSA